MAIKAVVDNLEGIDERYHDLYTEKNGKFELTGIEGMKTEADVTRLSSALEKERNDHKGTKKKFEVFADRKPEEILADLDSIPALKAAAEGKLDDAKINDLVEKRIGAKLGPVERKLKEASQQLAERDEVISGFQIKERRRTIHDAVRDAFGKEKGIQTSALDDALMNAESMFEINDEGKPVTKDNVGVTPGVDAIVWLKDMQQKRPHWWGPTGGGGASGNNGGGGAGSGNNPFSHEHWNMGEQGKMILGNRSRAEMLAKAAGTTIGGGRPKPKAK